MNTWNWIAEIFVPEEAGSTRGRTATGYPVASKLLLTAAHVLQDRDTLPQIRWQHDEGRQWHPAEVAWSGDDVGLDALLLKCDFPDQPEDWCPLDSRVPSTGERWESRGFASAGKRDSQRVPVSFWGETGPADERDEVLDLGVNYTVEAGTHLAGASGCPVIVKDRLIAIVKAYTEPFGPKRLEAVPVHKLLEVPEFREIVGFDKQLTLQLHRRRRERVLRDLVLLLQRQDVQPKTQELRSALATSLGLRVDTASIESARTIAQGLFGTLDEVVIGMTRACQSLRAAGNRREAEIVHDMFRLVIPLLYPVTATASIHGQIASTGIALVSVPAGLPIGAEAAFAVLDERAMKIVRSREGLFGSGYVRVASLSHGTGATEMTSRPEIGMSPRIDDETWEIMKEIATHAKIYLPPGALEAACRPSRPADENDRPSHLAQLESKMRRLGERLTQQLQIIQKLDQQRLYFAVQIPSDAWYGGNSGNDFELTNGVELDYLSDKQYSFEKAGTHPVAQKAANPYGLYDMLGNVHEWCRDGDRRYSREPQHDPVGSTEVSAGRVIRGGAWHSHAQNVRAACRSWNHPSFRDDYLGFRCRVQGGEPSPETVKEAGRANRRAEPGRSGSRWSNGIGTKLPSHRDRPRGS